jgi:hypothetical protein
LLHFSKTGKLEIQGSFGYKIGRKLRLMRVQKNADLLWQILVREIYVLMNHYKTIDSLQLQFESLKEVKNKPKKEAINKCAPFTDISVDIETTESWQCLLWFCQSSYINVLECGYFMNNGNECDLTFILDFNTKEVRLYRKESVGKITEYNRATINEIMEFDEMPTKPLIEILDEMNGRHKIYVKQLENIHNEQAKIQSIIDKAKELGHDENILQKAMKLRADMDLEEKRLNAKRRTFYYRLDALNLIDHIG